MQFFTSTDEDGLFKSLNKYREETLKLPKFTLNDHAACLANHIACQLKEEDCGKATDYSSTPNHKHNFTDFNKILKKCDINNKTIDDGVYLPVCVNNLDKGQVESNYTNSKYATYLKNSNYTGVGIGAQDDWMVVILSTNKTDHPTGSFSGAASLIANISMSNYLVALFFGLLVISVS